MFRKMLGLLTALVTTLAVVGVAWASSDAPATANAADRPSTTVTSDNRTTTTFDGSTSTSAPGSSTTTDRGSTTTTVRGSTTTSPSTTIPGSSTSTSDPGSTSTTTPGSTSTTTPGSTTSTSIDNNDPVPDGDYSFTVATAGTVVIRVAGGNLSLLSVTPNAGWSYEVDKNRYDVVEVEFTKGKSEASIKVEPGDGELDVEIEFKTG